MNSRVELQSSAVSSTASPVADFASPQVPNMLPETNAELIRLRSMVRQSNALVRQAKSEVDHLRDGIRIRDMAIEARDNDLRELRAKSHSRLWRMTEIARDLGSLIGFQHIVRLERALKRQIRRVLTRNASQTATPEISGRSPQHAIALEPPTVGEIKFDVHKHPDVSIIIPVYGKIAYTLNCLRSLQQHCSTRSFEVIIVDDGSQDQTSLLLPQIPGLRVVTPGGNNGFISSCNSGAEQAKGTYLLFLNNDTTVGANWLDALVDIFESHPDAGLAGSKLVYPDGLLQEAGGMVFSDGSACNYGRGDNPNKSEYNYVREVDYCSGASIMIPASLFRAVGGFDTRFSPAYYEDTDLAFKVRQEGRKVFYQPKSEVIHYEGVTSGTDLSAGVKQYQVVNHRKFLDKWQDALSDQNEPGGKLSLQKDRNRSGRALIIEVVTPTPDQDAGSGVVMDLIAYLQGLNYKCTFIPQENMAHTGDYTFALQQLGVECIYGVPDVAAHLREVGDIYDLVFLFRVPIVDQCRDDVRFYCPSAKIIFHTQDLYHLRMERGLAYDRSEEAIHQAALIKAVELDAIADLDHSIVVSEFEKHYLDSIGAGNRVSVVPMTADVHLSIPEFEERDNICYIGNFSHPPNSDAALFFIRDILPTVKQSLPKLKLYLIGRMPTKEIMSYAGPDIIVTGIAPDLTPYLKSCRLSIAPLRYGAGVKGKLLTSFGYGLPAVCTSVAAEGIGLTDGHDVMIADQPEDFAHALVAAYSDKRLWERLSVNCAKVVEEKYTRRHVNNAMRKILLSLGVAPN